jgi:hypothetical protein
MQPKEHNSVDLPQITRRVADLARRHFQAKEAQLETDPVTLSRGLVLDRLGPTYHDWGRDVNLVLVRVMKKNAHHKEGDEVIWEIPTDEELARIRPVGVHTRVDLLRLWVNSPGGRSSNDR